ncbi:MAG: polysaccharide deacetylase family protein [Clostridia bacterium]|nr:polysaccharide deacetylase family protein [Clostridia bacterium]
MQKIKKILSNYRADIFYAFLIVFSVLCLFITGTDSGRAVSAAVAERDIPIYCVGTDEKKLSISFDAAWGNEDTHQLIEILDRYNVKATFFIVGDWARKYPESVRELFDAGHEIMSHSDRHKHMTQLSKEQIIADIETCGNEIEKITGVRPYLFRAPYGEYDNKVVGTLRELGYYTIQWDVDSLDWKELGVQSIIDRVTGKVQNGSIVLFHNAAKYTPDALPTILETLLDEGYSFVPVSQLIYKDNYKVDHTGRQISLAQ